MEMRITRYFGLDNLLVCGSIQSMKVVKTWPKVLTEKSFKKRIYSYWQFWLLVLVLALGAWQASVHIEEWGNEARERVLEAWEDAWVAERQAKSMAIKAAYEQDTYGGATPQETWQMFIKALEAGDTDLAAKYFIVEKQEEMSEVFEAGSKNGGITVFLNDVKRIESGQYYKDSTDRFLFFVIGTDGKWDGVVELTYDLVRNKQSNIWKIYDL